MGWVLLIKKVLLKLDTNMTQSGLVAQARCCGCKTVTTDIPGFAQDYSGRSSGALVSITDNEEIILNAIINSMKTYQDDVEELEKLAKKNGHMAQLT